MKLTVLCDAFCPEMHEGLGGLREKGFCPEMHGGEGGGGRGGGGWMWVAAKFDCPKRQVAVPRRHRTPISIFEFHSTFHGQDS